MSGIVGIWHRDGRPLDAQVLAAMTGTLAHRGGPDGPALWTAGAIGLACQLRRTTPESAREVQPLADADGTAVVFDGRLDSRGEILAEIGAAQALAPDAPDPAFVLAAYRAFGDRFAERLNGDFALGLYDPRRGQLLLARDAVGVKPLYYHDRPGLFLFASEIKALVAHPDLHTRPDDEVVADLVFRLSRRDLGNRTFFENVRIVLPGELVVVSADRLVARPYWEFDPTRRVRFETFPEYVEAFRGLFTQAVRRRLRSSGPVGVSVSGGLDSSAIFCVAETLRRSDPRSYPAVVGATMGFPEGSAADERGFIVAIERSLEVSIRRFTNLPIGMMHECRLEAWHADGPVLVEQWNGFHALWTQIRELGANVHLSGSWGDHFLSDYEYVLDLFGRGAWLEAWRHLGVYSRYFDDRFLRWRLARRLARGWIPTGALPVLRRLRDRVPGLLKRYRWYSTEFLAHRDRPQGRGVPKPRGSTAHARSVQREIQSRYNRLFLEWNDKMAALHGFDVAFPFLDRDLLTFVMAVPGEMLSRDGVPKAILREALAGVLPDAIARRSTKADFTGVANEGMAQEYGRILELIRASGYAARFGYLRKDLSGAPFTLGDFGSDRNCLATWAVRDLLGLELWLQCFWGERPGPNP